MTNSVAIIFAGLLWMCQADPNSRRLMHHLLDVYNTLERPVAHDNETSIVSIQFQLNSVLYIDWNTQQVGINGYLHFEWQDVNLQWDSSEFGGVTTIQIPPHRIWKPDINLRRESSGVLDGTFPVPAIVRSNGSVIYEPPGKFEVNCEISFTEYPFDEQSCKFEFGSWSHDSKEIYLTVPGGVTEGDVSQLLKMPIFELLGFPVSQTEEPSRVTFTLNVRRKGDAILYYWKIFTVLWTTILILSFLMSPSLTHKLLLSIVALIIPVYAIKEITSSACCGTSDDNQLIRLVKFFSNLLAFSALVLLLNSFVIYIYHFKGFMPYKLKKKLKYLKTFYVFGGLGKNVEGTDNSSPANQDKKMEMEVLKQPARIQKGNEEWNHLGMILDRVLFVLGTLTAILFCCLTFPQFK